MSLVIVVVAKNTKNVVFSCTSYDDRFDLQQYSH